MEMIVTWHDEGRVVTVYTVKRAKPGTSQAVKNFCA